MKLGKEEIQKIVLGAMLVIGVIYSYFSFLLGPLTDSQEAARKSINSLTPEIAQAKAQIAKTKELEKSAPAAQLTARQIEAMIPEGAPVAWFPTRMADFFKKQGFDKAFTRMTSEGPEKELPGFRRLTWTVDLPKVEFMPFACAIAQLENEEPLIEISNLQMDASREEVETQHALLTVNNLIKQ
jgi:hypothetical protein